MKEANCTNCGTVYTVTGSIPKGLKCFCTGSQFKAIK